jgi:menaquinol-cytochrome c reductase iron-sulfur subunit
VDNHGGKTMNENLLTRAGSTRREFLKLFTGVFSSVIAIALGIPAVGTLVGTIYQKKKLRWAKVAEMDSLPVGEPTKVSWTDEKVDAFIRERVERDVWAIRHSATEVTIFSPVCPHLGCRYDWHPEKHEFICPCHGSIYSITGKVLGGPAPRPLDILPWKLEKGGLYVAWERFQVGIPEKIRV